MKSHGFSSLDRLTPMIREYVDFMWSEIAMHGLHMHWSIASYAASRMVMIQVIEDHVH